MKEETILRTPQFEIAAVRVGAFLVVRLRGRYVDDLLLPLRKRVFNQPKTNFAVDVTGMSDLAMPLARELYFASQSLKGTPHRLVLLRPPEKILSLLSLLSTAPLPSVSSENDLGQDLAQTDERLAQRDRELARIRAEIQNTPVWQQFLRDAGWCCPYCGKLQEDVKISSRVNVVPVALERIYDHVWLRCPLFRPGSGGRYRPLTELQAVIRAATADDLAAAKMDVAVMETKLTQLEKKAKKAEAFEQSLKIASARQRRLLPEKPPTVFGAEISILYRPAERVSGDFYDFVEFPDGRLGLVIGDVAGHGIEAAILMGMAKKVLALRLEEFGDPVETVRRANHDLYRDLDRQIFVTAFVALLDAPNRSLSYARAGHNPPLLYRAGRTRRLEAGGLGLGMSDGPVFERALVGESVSLEEQELLLLYTDGIVEAKDGSGEEYGIERLERTLGETDGKNVNFLLGILGHELDRFSGGRPQEDDITAVAVKIA